MIPLSTMSQYRKRFIENELYRCETQLKTLLGSNNNGVVSNPNMTTTNTELLKNVTLEVKFQLPHKSCIVNVEISHNGSVFIRNYSNNNHSHQLTNPLMQRVLYIEHVDYNRTDGREQCVKIVYFDPETLIPNDVMHGIKAAENKTAINRGNCVISEFPYFIYLDFAVSDEMFP
jgi:hypothetical protein